MKTYKFIIQILSRFPGLCTINVLMSVIVSAMNGCFILAIGPLVDYYMHPDLKDISPFSDTIFSALTRLGIPISLFSLMVIFLGFVLLTTVSSILARYLILRTKTMLSKDMMMGMYQDFFQADWPFFSKTKQGVLWNTFTQELTVVADAFSAITLFLAFCIQMIIPVIIPFYISWQVTAISLIAASIFSLPFILFGKVSYRIGRKFSTTANLVMSHIQQNISSAKVVLGFGNHLKSVSKLDKLFNQRLSISLQKELVGQIMPTLYLPFIALMIITALLAARTFTVPLSDVAILLLALRQVAISIGNILSYKNTIDSGYPSYEQIERLRKKAVESPQWSGTKLFDGFRKDISLNHLTFSYTHDRPVLQDICIKIPKGQMTALVGRSGAGKSTLIDLILGFYKPDKGAILFDGMNILDFDILSYRQKIGYVPQENILFHMSVRENLLWSQEDATQEEIDWACRLAHADEFIKDLPNGYNTVVGERGVRLSGGQVQRIALARALLRKPELLILDEATSSLDTQSERFIQEAIEDIAQQTTVIVIAHRLSTIKKADCIYVLDQGKVVEQGTYNALIHQNGMFASMIQLQELEVVV